MSKEITLQTDLPIDSRFKIERTDQSLVDIADRVRALADAIKPEDITPPNSLRYRVFVAMSDPMYAHSLGNWDFFNLDAKDSKSVYGAEKWVDAKIRSLARWIAPEDTSFNISKPRLALRTAAVLSLDTLRAIFVPSTGVVSRGLMFVAALIALGLAVGIGAPGYIIYNIPRFGRWVGKEIRIEQTARKAATMHYNSLLAQDSSLQKLSIAKLKEKLEKVELDQQEVNEEIRQNTEKAIDTLLEEIIALEERQSEDNEQQIEAKRDEIAEIESTRDEAIATNNKVAAATIAAILEHIRRLEETPAQKPSTKDLKAAAKTALRENRTMVSLDDTESAPLTEKQITAEVNRRYAEMVAERKTELEELTQAKGQIAREKVDRLQPLQAKMAFHGVAGERGQSSSPKEKARREEARAEFETVADEILQRESVIWSGIEALTTPLDEAAEKAIIRRELLGTAEEETPESVTPTPPPQPSLIQRWKDRREINRIADEIVGSADEIVGSIVQKKAAHLRMQTAAETDAIHLFIDSPNAKKFRDKRRDQIKGEIAHVQSEEYRAKIKQATLDSVAHLNDEDKIAALDQTLEDLRKVRNPSPTSSFQIPWVQELKDLHERLKEASEDKDQFNEIDLAIKEASTQFVQNLETIWANLPASQRMQPLGTSDRFIEAIGEHEAKIVAIERTLQELQNDEIKHQVNLIQTKEAELSDMHAELKEIDETTFSGSQLKQEKEKLRQEIRDLNESMQKNAKRFMEIRSIKSGNILIAKEIEAINDIIENPSHFQNQRKALLTKIERQGIEINKLGENPEQKKKAEAELAEMEKDLENIDKIIATEIADLEAEKTELRQKITTLNATLEQNIEKINELEGQTMDPTQFNGPNLKKIDEIRNLLKTLSIRKEFEENIKKKEAEIAEIKNNPKIIEVIDQQNLLKTTKSALFYLRHVPRGIEQWETEIRGFVTNYIQELRQLKQMKETLIEQRNQELDEIKRAVQGIFVSVNDEVDTFITAIIDAELRQLHFNIKKLNDDFTQALKQAENLQTDYSRRIKAAESSKFDTAEEQEKKATIAENYRSKLEAQTKKIAALTTLQKKIIPYIKRKIIQIQTPAYREMLRKNILNNFENLERKEVIPHLHQMLEELHSIKDKPTPINFDLDQLAADKIRIREIKAQKRAINKEVKQIINDVIENQNQNQNQKDTNIEKVKRWEAEQIAPIDREIRELDDKNQVFILQINKLYVKDFGKASDRSGDISDDDTDPSQNAEASQTPLPDHLRSETADAPVDDDTASNKGSVGGDVQGDAGPGSGFFDGG